MVEVGRVREVVAGEHPDLLHAVAREARQESMANEVAGRLGIIPRKRTESRTRHRDGTRSRLLTARVGNPDVAVSGIAFHSAEGGRLWQRAGGPARRTREGEAVRSPQDFRRTGFGVLGHGTLSAQLRA